MTEEKELGGIEEQLVGKKIKEEMSYTRINVGRTRKMVKLKRCLPYGDTNHDILLKKWDLYSNLDLDLDWVIQILIFLRT